ncbi:unnamed protein product [Tuber aestivum]|uniref:Uncharacterized protein n=1 Tax=Tuber aestivum TaxID=59557 RepID=A0A292Q7J8_9PEZI|nr:unnamed protein product [Tuber aestivum]
MTTITEEARRKERRAQRRLRRKCPPQSSYHHIPCSAALDFARTATPEPLDPEKVHKLTLPVVEHYTKDLPSDVAKPSSRASGPDSLPAEDVLGEAGEKDLRRRVAQRNVDPSRYRFTVAQFQIPPVAAEEESSEEYLHRISSHRRRSLSLQLVPTDRPDWTEQDECSEPTPSIFSKVGPMLRKSENVWSVRPHNKHVAHVTPDDGSVLSMRAGSNGYPRSPTIVSHMIPELALITGGPRDCGYRAFVQISVVN